MSLGFKIKLEYIKIKDNIKYRLTTSHSQQLHDKIEDIYDTALFNVRHVGISLILNKDISAINSINIANFNANYTFFNSLFRSESEVVGISDRKMMSLNILKDYVLNEFKVNIQYSNTDFGFTQAHYNLANTAKLNAILLLENELENLLHQIEIYKTIKLKNNSNNLSESNSLFFCNREDNNKMGADENRFEDYIKEDCLNEILTLLREKNIVNSENVWNDNSLDSRISRDIIIFFIKLINMGVLNVINQSKFVESSEFFFKKSISTSVFNEILNDNTKEIISKNDKKVYDKLNFLNVIKTKQL